VHAETLESTIKKDDFLYGKAFSDTKPMAEDPQKVAQRRLSQSTVAPGIVLGLDIKGEDVIRPKKRKAEIEDEGPSSSKKAKKEKKDKREKKEKEKEKKSGDEQKVKIAKKVRKTKQAEDDANENLERRKSVMDSGETSTVDSTDPVAHDLRKKTKRKKQEETGVTGDSGDIVKKKKNSKKLKNKGSAEASADTTGSSEAGSGKEKQKSKRSKRASTTASEG